MLAPLNLMGGSKWISIHPPTPSPSPLFLGFSHVVKAQFSIQREALSLSLSLSTCKGFICSSWRGDWYFYNSITTSPYEALIILPLGFSTFTTQKESVCLCVCVNTFLKDRVFLSIMHSLLVIVHQFTTGRTEGGRKKVWVWEDKTAEEWDCVCVSLCVRETEIGVIDLNVQLIT